MQPSDSDPNARLLKILKAPPEQITLIDRVLAGEKPFPHHRSQEGPLLLGMGAAAKYLGVSRPTLWRMLRDGRLKKVEVRSNSFRVCRRDLERFVEEIRTTGSRHGKTQCDENKLNQERNSN